MRYRLLLFSILLSVNTLFSQDAVLSQYNSFLLYTNMAMAGSKGCSRVIMGERLQWLNINGGYKTSYFSYDQYSRGLRSGIGFQYCGNDEMYRFIQNDAVHLTLSPHFSALRRTDSLGKLVIKPAIDFGYMHTHLDTNRMSYGDNIEPLYGYIFNTQEGSKISDISSTDFGAGMLIYGQEFYGGIYFHHLTSASASLDYDVIPIYTRMTFQGGYVLRDTAVLGKFSLLPSFLYERQCGSERLDLTMTARYARFSVGASYRMNNTWILLLGFHHKIIQLGYSYEVRRLSSKQYFGTTHEIHVGLNFVYRNQKKKIRMLDFIDE